MKKKKKGSPKTTHSLHDYTDKSTDSARLIQSVRKIFLSGGKFIAKEVNSLARTNDVRKLISVLRNKEGWKVEERCLPNGCNLYWLTRKGG